MVGKADKRNCGLVDNGQTVSILTHTNASPSIVLNEWAAALIVGRAENTGFRRGYSTDSILFSSVGY